MMEVVTSGGSLEERRMVAKRLINALFDSHEKTQDELRTLAHSQVLMPEAQRKTEEKLAEATDKLNALIGLMDQHLGEQREGRR